MHIIIAICSKINPLNNDCKQLKNIELDLKELKDLIGIKHHDGLMTLKDSIKYICSTLLEIDNDEYWTAVSFLDKPKIFYRKNIVSLNVSEEFMPHLTDLQHFLGVRLQAIQCSNRALIFYTALKSIHSRTITSFPIIKLQKACGINYSGYGQFKMYFLAPVIQELEQVGIKVSFAEEKVGRRVTALSFAIDETEAKFKTIENPIEISAKQSVPLSDNTAKVVDPRKQLKDKVSEIFKYYTDVFEKDGRFKMDKPREMCIRARLLDGYTVEECKARVDFIKNSPFHMGDNPQSKIYNGLRDIVFNKNKFEKDFDAFKKTVKQKIDRGHSDKRLKEMEELLNGQDRGHDS